MPPTVRTKTKASRSSTTQPGKRRALLICNGRFDALGVNLPGVATDAKQLSDVLADPNRGGFEVECLLDKGLLEVRMAIARACSGSGEQDTLLLYYGGASLKGDDGNLQLPVFDSVNDQLTATCVESEFVLSRMRHSKCRRFVLIVDGCQSGAFFHNNRGIPDGMISITSCSEDEFSEETPAGGAFTQAMIRALTDPAADTNHDGVVTVDEVFDFVQRDLRTQKSGLGANMHPQKWVWNLPEPIPMIRSTLRVFLSYSTKDAAQADRLVEEMAKRGIAAWRDISAVPGGSDWIDSILRGLEQSQALLCLLTGNSVDSTWVKRELEFANRKKKIPILPVTLDNVEPPDWFSLQFDHIQRHQLDFAKHETLDTLVQSIRRVIAEGK